MVGTLGAASFVPHTYSQHDVYCRMDGWQESRRSCDSLLADHRAAQLERDAKDAELHAEMRMKVQPSILTNITTTIIITVAITITLRPLRLCILRHARGGTLTPRLDPLDFKFSLPCAASPQALPQSPRPAHNFHPTHNLPACYPPTTHNPQSTIHNPQPTTHNPQPTIHNPQSTIHNPQSTIHNPQSTIHNPPQPTTHNPQRTTHNPQPTTHNPQPTIHNPQSTPKQITKQNKPQTKPKTQNPKPTTHNPQPTLGIALTAVFEHARVHAGI